MAGRAGPRITVAAVLVLTAMLYSATRAFPFVYEDDNWLGQAQTMPTQYPIPGRALTLASHAAMTQIVGPDAGWFHVANVALHLINGVLVYAVASALIGPLMAIGAACVFLLHPLASSAVAYVTGRADLLMTCGVLLAAWCALGASPWRWVGVAVGLGIAAASKEIGVMGLPLVALTLIQWRGWRAWSWLIGVAGLGAVLAVTSPYLVTWWEMPAQVGGPSLPWVEWIGLQLGMLWHLLALVVWPVGLSIDHDALALTTTALVGAALLTALCGALVLATWRTRPLVAWSLAWVALSVAPRFVFRTSEFLTEVHLYLSMVGISVLAGAVLAWLWTPIPRLTERTA